MNFRKVLNIFWLILELLQTSSSVNGNSFENWDIFIYSYWTLDMLKNWSIFYVRLLEISSEHCLILLEIVLTNFEMSWNFRISSIEVFRNKPDNFGNGSENLTETLNKQAGAASNICTYRCMYINVNIYIYVNKKYV